MTVAAGMLVEHYRGESGTRGRRPLVTIELDLVRSDPRGGAYTSVRTHPYGTVAEVPGDVPLTIDTAPLPADA